MLKSNKERKKIKAKYDKEYRRIHKKRLTKVSHIYRQKHRQKFRDIRKRYRQNNLKKVRRAEKKYAKNNPQILAASSARRRAVKRKAAPSWGDKEIIKAFYKISKAFSNWTGIKYHVDHIVPLSSYLVCGLHVEHNLRIITARENIIKSNKFWPYMP